MVLPALHSHDEEAKAVEAQLKQKAEDVRTLELR